MYIIRSVVCIYVIKFVIAFTIQHCIILDAYRKKIMWRENSMLENNAVPDCEIFGSVLMSSLKRACEEIRIVM